MQLETYQVRLVVHSQDDGHQDCRSGTSQIDPTWPGLRDAEIGPASRFVRHCLTNSAWTRHPYGLLIDPKIVRTLSAQFGTSFSSLLPGHSPTGWAYPEALLTVPSSQGEISSTGGGRDGPRTAPWRKRG